MLLMINFEKAFHSVSWSFIQKSLDSFNSGPDFNKWTQSFYKNIKTCVSVNGQNTLVQCISQMWGQAKDGVDVLYVCLRPDGSFSLLVLWLYSSVQYSVHRFSISRSSVRYFPEWSWTVVVVPCFTVVKSFTSWCALLLLFFLWFSSISQHSSLIQF